MIDARTLGNLLAYSAQVACIVALATVLHHALRLRSPRLRHGFWRCLLVVCLVLPWVQRWQAPQAAAASAAPLGTPSPLVLTVSLATGKVQSNEPTRWEPIAARVLVAGAAVRLLWTAIGLWQLRRLRRAGEPVADYDELQRLLGTSAVVRYTQQIDQPVTFGVWRPVVALPERLRQQPPEIRRAVVCHELLHVRRRDWMWLLAEETLRAAFWFHPATWWVISRVQLTREEVVDEMVVRATGERRAYLEALLTFADAAPLTPAAAFSRRRHLFTRMMLISKEAVMSSKRVVALAVTGVVIVGTGSWYAAWAFPLQGAAVATAPTPGRQLQTAAPVGAGPLESQARPVTPENPIPRRLRSVAVIPPGGFQGPARAVSLRLTLDTSGRVAEVRPSGSFAPDVAPLFQAAIDAVRQWQYAPPAEAPLTFAVAFMFSGGPDGVVIEAHDGMPARGSFRVVNDVPARPGTATGRSGGAAALPGGVGGGARGGVTGGVPGGVAGGLSVTPGTVASPSPGAAIRVGGQVTQPTKTRHVDPIYPAIAQSARVQGVVILEVVIATDGVVTDARILRSIPLLDEAALAAVRQWEYTPTLLNGTPVPVIMTVTIQFSLPEPPPQQ